METNQPTNQTQLVELKVEFIQIESEKFIYFIFFTSHGWSLS